ncbi:MAG: hypothetical protein WCQ95_10750 [Bacteroidota bacterium]
MKRYFYPLFLIIVLLFATKANAQQSTPATTTEKKQCKFPFKLNVGADIMSRYIWRGMDYGNSASIQPTLSFNLGGFELGYWGAVALTTNYLESDLYLKYTFKGFSACITDYYIPALASNVNDTRYGFCKSPHAINFDTISGINTTKYTAHTLEGMLCYKGPEKFPISVMVASYVYGNDKTPTDTVFTNSKLVKTVNYKNRYSTYIELGYSFTIKQFNFDVFAGATPFSSAYSSPAYTGGFAVVNTGVTAYRNIKITEHFSLPLKASVIYNPQSSGFHFVFGLTL